MAKPNRTLDKISDGVVDFRKKVNHKVEDIDVEKAVNTAIKIPGAIINRESYLSKELRKYYSETVVINAVKTTPFRAGVSKEHLDLIAKDAIKYETTKATFASTAAGIPGGLAMAATVPADVVQYFVFMIRVAQKLAYLYGYPEINFTGTTDVLDDASMNELLIFLGVMFGVESANMMLQKLAALISKKLPEKLAKQALMKGTIYPIVKKIAKAVGANMTKEIFAGGVGKMVPIIGGVVSGGLTFATFKPYAYRLKNELEKNYIADVTGEEI